jgi:hypothetical protein
MSREQFVSRYGADHGEFWDNIMGDIDDLEDKMDEGINKTTNNAMEAALAELRKLAGI